MSYSVEKFFWELEDKQFFKSGPKYYMRVSNNSAVEDGTESLVQFGPRDKVFVKPDVIVVDESHYSDTDEDMLN